MRIRCRRWYGPGGHGGRCSQQAGLPTSASLRPLSYRLATASPHKRILSRQLADLRSLSRDSATAIPRAPPISQGFAAPRLRGPTAWGRRRARRRGVTRRRQRPHNAPLPDSHSHARTRTFPDHSNPKPIRNGSDRPTTQTPPALFRRVHAHRRSPARHSDQGKGRGANSPSCLQNY